MAGILSLFGRRHEPMPRAWHTSCQVGSQVVVHGGRTEDYSESTKRRLASAVEVFDLYTEVWQQKEVTGEAPAPGVYSAASASVDDDLFTFGGIEGSGPCNSLHRLKHASQWIELCPKNERAESPMAKYGAEMVAFGDSLAVFGGYGIPHGSTQPGSSFIKDTGYTDGRGWTNEFHIYNLNGDVWISPDITGERPPPCALFSLTSIDNRRAVLFGGYNEEQGRMNGVYIIDLLSMHWTKLNKSGDGPWPEERSGHAACCLNYGQQHPQLLVTGGMNREGKVLGDSWVLDVDSGRWRKVSGTLQPRWGHSISAFCLVDGVKEVTMFGGSADPFVGSDEKQPKLADTTLLQFCSSGQSEWEVVSVTPFSKLGSEEKVSVKKVQREEREKQMEKRLQMAEERAQRTEERVQPIEQQDVGTGERVQQAEARADELQRRLVEERFVVQLQERERVLGQVTGRARKVEERVQSAEQGVQTGKETVQQESTLDMFEEREEERIAFQQPEGYTMEQAHKRYQQGGEVVQRAQKREQDWSHTVEWNVQQAELVMAAAEPETKSLQWRLGMVEEREQESLAVKQLKAEIQQAGERVLQAEEMIQLLKEREQQRLQEVEQLIKELQWIKKNAQQAEERVQRADERVQREREWEEDKERAHLTEEPACQVEARAEELQKRLDEVQGRKEERLTVQQQPITAEQKTVPICGADIVAETTLQVIPGTPLAHHWKGHGLKLHIPADALKPGTPTETMTIQASLSGQYQLPDDTELVSGIYWVAFPRRFSQPVTIELQHCAYLEYSEELSPLFFITAKCNQKTLPYQFQPLPGGRFSTNSCYGAIELSHFSGVGVGKRRSKGKGRSGKGKDKEKEKEEKEVEKQGEEKYYTGRVFYIPQVATTWLMHFTIFHDLELCLQEVEKFYAKQRAEAGPHLDVIFDSDEVFLDIPLDGKTLSSGWSLHPLVYPPRLLRQRVDSYKPGRTIHSCQVELVWKERAERLCYKLHITGLRPAETYITVTRDPSLPGSQQSAEDKKFEDTLQLDFRQFCKPNESLLMNLIGCKVKNKWREIGIGLGVKKEDLTSIQAEEAGKTDSIQHCMQRVFLKWESAMTSEYTWQNLANVLNSPIVNEKAAVLELYKSLCEHNKTE